MKQESGSMTQDLELFLKRVAFRVTDPRVNDPRVNNPKVNDHQNNPKDTYTIGRLSYISSQDRSMTSLCDTLEPSKEPMALTQQTSRLIPTGKYKVIVNHSNRFNRDLPLLINVAGFTGIRIHRGNSSKDTQGCILCGINDKAGWVSDSAKYEQKIIDLIRAYKECWITVCQ